jgi:hypothetical protein
LGCHICASTAICAVASVHRQPFVPLHRATALCGCLYASLRRLCATAITHPLHVYERFVGFASCLVSRLGCHIVWQLSAAAFKHPCLKLWASTITHPCVCGRWGRRIVQRLCATAIVHPCTTRTVRVRPPAPKKAGLCLFRHNPAFLVPMAGVEPARYCYQRILSPSRLPIPSHRLIKMCCKTALHNGNSDFTV